MMDVRRQGGERPGLPPKLGRYVIERRLSSGGMADVYLARRDGAHGFTQRVVIKTAHLRRQDDGTFRNTLINEARIGAVLDHPNLVQVLDVAESDGVLHVVMEYVDGVDLNCIIKAAQAKGRKLPAALACRIVSQVLTGLSHAHGAHGPTGESLGLVHRDVSPANVMVTRDGTVKLVDFGIAKATQVTAGEHTQAGQLKGKLSYMSPEQALQRPLDARTDVFSTGVMLWELLVWRRLFRRAHDADTIRALLHEPVTPPGEIVSDLPPELDKVVMRAIDRHRSTRYATAEEMRLALDGVMVAQGWDQQASIVEWLTELGDLGGDDHDEADADTAPYDAPTSHYLPPPEVEVVVDLASPSPLPSRRADQTMRVKPQRPMTAELPVHDPRKRATLPLAVLMALCAAGLFALLLALLLR
jgi:eukaryotic-like serine/threonine-protein kinase